MTTNENGGCPEGQTADGLDVVQDATRSVPNDNYPRPMGATPFVPVVTDLLAALREAEGYVVAEIVGDVDGQPEVRYEGTWRCYLAQGGA